MMIRVAAVIAILIAIVVAVGYMLPVKHKASRDATLAANPDSVFAIIAATGSYPNWRTGVTSVEQLEPRDGKARFRERSKHNEIPYLIEAKDPPRRMVFRIDDPRLPFGGTWTHELTADGSGTRLRITEDGEVYNPVFRFMSRFVFGHTATIDTYIADLKKHLARR